MWIKILVYSVPFRLQLLLCQNGGTFLSLIEKMAVGRLIN